MAEALLSVEGIGAGYRGKPVLKEVSLAIPAGSVTMVVGPNGHGKTTLLRCISGLVALEAGAIRLAGARIDGMRADRIVAAGVVHIPQGDLPFPEMSVADNLLMGAWLPPARAEAARRLEEIYGLLPRLAERRRQMASTLSGGERRMLAIGRGLMAGGRILLVDEPSLGLAPIVIERIYEVLRGLKAEGRTLLLVEENLSRAGEIANSVHLLDDGRMVWQGDADALLERPELFETYLGA